MVVLKRLADARRDGDTVRAVIRASALNQDGRTNGITAPNGPSQAALIAGLYRRCGIDPASIGYVEAHGTGTRLGDPIELAALAQALGGTGCAVGSVKANIGHTLPAAGIAGLLKLLLAIEAGRLPPDPALAGQGERVPLPGTPFHRPGRLSAWPGGAPRGAVSAFGFGGTNAHVVIEPPPPGPPLDPAPGHAFPVILSAPDAAALRRRAASLGAWLDAQADGLIPARFGWTLQGAATFPSRGGFVAADRETVRLGLAALAAGDMPAEPCDGAAGAEAAGQAVAQFLAGRPADWPPGLPRGPRLRLPGLPFARDRFWIDAGNAPAPPVEAAATAEPQDHALLATLCSFVADALMLPEEQVEPESGFAALGLELHPGRRTRGAAQCPAGYRLRAIDFYDHPTPARLARAIGGDPPRGVEPAPIPPPDLPAAADPGLRSTLRDVIAEALYTTPDAVTGTAELRSLGLDSILAVEMAKLVGERVGVSVRAIDFYEAGTLDGLVALLGPRRASPAGVPAPAIAGIPVAIPVAASGPEPIAIIGLAGRFPGASDLDDLWTLLRDGRDAITEIPPERWPLAGFFDQRRGVPGRSYTRWGGFLDGIDQFDPLFFRISPREAELIDPQERLFLTCAQQAVEQAGWVPGELGGAAVGVFAGLMYGEWQLLAAAASGPDRFVPAHAPYWSVANRVSFTFGWQGPSMAVDSACSSSLTALHLACASLRRGECAAAIAGGVNLSLHPRKYLGLSAGHFAASDGRCRSFGAGGDGYVPGEGVGVAVLKRLGDAQRDGDTVLAVIRGSAVNHGGRTGGYAVPSPEGQAGAIRAALADAGLDAGSIGYVEAHGTGTALGDPIEIEGLRRALGPGGTVPIGSVKSNLGHLEAAAGMAALCKVVLQLRHRALAPSLHADPPNPELDLAASGFAVVRDVQPWKARLDAAGRTLPLRAGISSFGAGGSNAHLVLEEAPVPPSRGRPPAGPFLVPLSAPSAPQLARLAAALAETLADAEAADPWALADLAHTLRIGRAAWPERAILLAADRTALRAGLGAIAEGRQAVGVWRGRKGAAAATGHDPDSPEQTALAWIAGETALPPIPGGRRVPVPPTPLDPRRCWLPDPVPAGPLLAPLPSGARTLTWATEDPVLAEHRIAGRCLVPAAALLLAVAAAVQAGSDAAIRLSDLVFAAPLIGDAAGATATLRFDGDSRFTVADGERTLMSGRAGFAAAPPDIVAPGGPEPDDAAFMPGPFYAALQAAGAAYGPDYRRIRAARSDGRSARVALLPGGPAAAMLDAAFQAVALLAPTPSAHAPFTLAEASFHGSLEQAVAVHLQRGPDEAVVTADLAVTDAAGGVLAVVSGLVLRPVGAEKPPAPVAAPPDGMALLAPHWIAEPPPPSTIRSGTVAVVGGPAPFRAALRTAYAAAEFREIPLDIAPGGAVRMAAAIGAAEEIVFLAGLDAVPEPQDLDAALATLHAAETTGVVALLGVLRALCESQPLRPRRLKLVTRGVQAVAPDDPVHPWQAAALGLAKVAGLEVPRLSSATIDLPAAWPDAALPGLAAAIAAEPGDTGRTEIALRDGQRLVQRIAPVTVPAPGFNPFRPLGVHVIAGGARGIGLEVAKHIARRARGRLLLLGRSPAGSAAAALDAVSAAGGTAIYRQVDLLDAVALRAAIAEVVDLWGPVNGAIHSALVLADRSLLRLDEPSLRAALDPKARGAVALAEAVADQPLDYLAFFSSANAVFGNAGQANYVAGCRFKDAYAAHLRAARGIPALSIGWGFWGEVGVVASDELRTRLHRQGILPISVADGLDAFERALCAGVPHLLPVAGTAAAFERLGVHAGPPPAEAMPADADPGQLLLAASRRHPITLAEAAEEAALARLETQAVRAVAATLRGLGLVPGETEPVAVWAARLSVVPSQQPLFAALLDMIHRAGLGQLGDGLFALHPVPPGEAALADAAPELPAHARLLESCIAALPDVLSGRSSGLAALMPGGSTALVEAVYRDAAVTFRLNRLLAAAVATRVAGLPAGAPPRILEIGGGTAATTQAVVPALAAARPDATYLFTDLSPAFLPEAERRFRPVLPGFGTARLDIAGDPGALGQDGFDLILATNVLHATPDLRASLAACRALLRPGGLLLLNETTAVRDFATLTFGLTPGWWHAADTPLRLPHGPAASGETWRRLLAELRLRPGALPAGGCGGAADRVRRDRRAVRAPAADRLHGHLAALIGGVLKLDPAVIDPDQFIWHLWSGIHHGARSDRGPGDRFRPVAENAPVRGEDRRRAGRSAPGRPPGRRRGPIRAAVRPRPRPRRRCAAAGGRRTGSPPGAGRGRRRRGRPGGAVPRRPHAGRPVGPFARRPQRDHRSAARAVEPRPALRPRGPARRQGPHPLRRLH